MRYPRSAMKLLCATVLLGLGLGFGLVGEVAAQDTASAIRGRLVDDSGNVLAGATVVVRDSRTGATRTLQSNNSGMFYAANLPVGGPYVLTINQVKTVTIDNIQLGDVYTLTVNMGPQRDAGVEEIIVLGSANTLVDVAAGPAATFGQFELDTMVAYNRDIRDVYTVDPRFNLDGDARNSQINCIGKHPRFNSLSLDGVAQNDRFGLNNNGYATATGMPFPYAAIGQVSAELAPFDVTYGGFSACNINAVTKSGTNTWTGNAFFEGTNDGLRGDSITPDNGQTINMTTEDYEEEYYGFSVGGPLVEDKLFIFGAYEKGESPEFIAQGFQGSTNGEARDWLSQADFNRIRDIANDVYSYDPGGEPGNGLQTTESYIIRLDYNINENHRASLIYNGYEGIEDRASDGDPNEFEFSNHFYKKGAELETLTARLQSQWSDAFSTEVYINTNEMVDTQRTVGPKDFGDHQVSLVRNTVYLGADDSRQANQLNWESTYYRLQGQYLAGDHVLTFGYERDELSVLNQFVQHSNGGEYDYFDTSGDNPAHCAALTAQGRFDDPMCGLSGIDRFELGRPSRIYYGSGGGSNDAADATANYRNNMDIFYFQDEWYIPRYNLTLVSGLRYERMGMTDRPTFNQAFTSTAGVRNDANLDGVDLLMPRVGFTWEASNNLTLRGGLGLYSGGNPNVWITNAWSNDGISNVQLQLRNFDAARSVLSDIALSGDGRPGYDVPQEMFDQVAAVSVEDGSDENLVLIDPNYKQPGEMKYALGATYSFDNGISIDADVIYSKQDDPAYYEDIAQDQVGTTAAGTPIYDFARGENNFMLTNAQTDGEGLALSLVAKQRTDWGLDWLFGYAYTDQTDVSPMTSFVASSNFGNLATTDLLDPMPATSNYVAPHRFTARVSYGRDFIPNHETRFTALFFRKQGQPQSFVMSSQPLEGDQRFGRHLLYIPAANDPNAVFGSEFNNAAWDSFIRENGFGRFQGGFVPRNESHARWSSRMDFRIDQEIPFFFGSRARAYLKVYNMLNLLNDEWGVQYDAEFFSQEVIDMSLDAQNRFVFNEFSPDNINDLRENASLYEIRLGLQIEF